VASDGEAAALAKRTALDTDTGTSSVADIPLSTLQLRRESAQTVVTFGATFRVAHDRRFLPSPPGFQACCRPCLPKEYGSCREVTLGRVISFERSPRGARRRGCADGFIGRAGHCWRASASEGQSDVRSLRLCGEGDLHVWRAYRCGAPRNHVSSWPNGRRAPARTWARRCSRLPHRTRQA
jgi:hypothetical protein